MAALPRALRPLARSSTRLPTPLTPTLRRTYASTIQPRPATDTKPPSAAEAASEDIDNLSGDPNMNGDYPDPSLHSALPVKRSLRDPYGGPDGPWWDPVERRNYGETLHEDNDILGVFTTEEYRHFSPGWGGVLMPSAPRTFPGGLEAELGGPGAVRARMTEDEASVL
ncbi:uncharacterized protein LTR77_004091 [Saxophila tyrrhenica]|uniref:Uncharacterized protein n=1 Tax=Saxophila tyrrhenica TaxID=1690608 RepID=A0AAV9PES2_9PEZI|nr:hypothetical protein LTR77_004091 [Saxophila tyrrhenica]